METRKGDKCPCGRSGRADNMKRHKAICAALKSFDVEFTKRQVKQWLTVSTKKKKRQKFMNTLST